MRGPRPRTRCWGRCPERIHWLRRWLPARHRRRSWWRTQVNAEPCRSRRRRPGAGEAASLLDPAGRLIGLRAIPPDSVPAANGGRPAWSVLWAAAGLDPATFAPTPLARPVPATCDSAAAWSGPVPWNDGEHVTVQMGASRGRLSHFTIVHNW